MVEKIEEGESKHSEKDTYETIQALFFMVAFSTALGILGSGSVYSAFGINSLLAEFFVMVCILMTYTFNYHMIAYCCKKSSQKYNYAEYLEDKYGKIPAMLYDILMTIHNVVLLAYIQRQISLSIFLKDTNSYDLSYYTLALVNIPLIFISLTSDFKKIKWFCIVLTLTWIYIFMGAIVGTMHEGNYSPDILSHDGFGRWLVKLVGFQIYFSSAFQSIPFIYKEVKHEKTMQNVINLSGVVSLVIFFTIYMYTTLNIDADSPYYRLRNFGLALIGACAVVVNVIPARFSLAQFLAGNDANTMEKSSASDKLLSVLIIMGSIIISLFLVNDGIWNVVIGLGVILSAFLGIVVPPVVILSADTTKELLSSNNTKKKIMLFAYLGWIAFISITAIIGAFYIMIDGRVK